MATTIDFVKGHCGWDVVTLVPSGQVAAHQELACAWKILSAPVDGGLEVGFLGRGPRGNQIELRMVNSTTRTWIPMCGGMTQVIGKALVETSLQERFEIDVSKDELNIELATPAGIIPIAVCMKGGRVSSITTGMSEYIGLLYKRGVEELTIDAVPLLRVGKYAVIDLRALEERYPGEDFTRRDCGPHLHLVNSLLKEFREYLGETGVNGMLYDDRPEGPGQFRVFPRFYSDNLSAARLPWEFQCGTGSMAVVLALARIGRLPFAGRFGEVLLEWGSHRSTPDPYGIRLSTMTVETEGGVLAAGGFSHSVVEIVAEGKLTLPTYRVM